MMPGPARTPSAFEVAHFFPAGWRWCVSCYCWWAPESFHAQWANGRCL